MKKTDLHTAITELAQMNIDLEKRGGPEKTGRLFERLLQKQETILKEIGLPLTPYYEGLLQFESVPWEKEVDDLIELLFREAENYKNRDGNHDLNLLKEAISAKRDSSFILPQIGISTHVYTEYVYHRILLEQIDEPENVLKELKIVSEHDVLEIIGRMTFSYEWLKNGEVEVKALEEKGLKYIRQYFKDKFSDIKDMIEMTLPEAIFPF
jgi:hypothetical protein